MTNQQSTNRSTLQLIDRRLANILYAFGMMGQQSPNVGMPNQHALFGQPPQPMMSNNQQTMFNNQHVNFSNQQPGVNLTSGPGGPFCTQYLTLLEPYLQQGSGGLLADLTDEAEKFLVDLAYTFNGKRDTAHLLILQLAMGTELSVVETGALLAKILEDAGRPMKTILPGEVIQSGAYVSLESGGKEYLALEIGGDGVISIEQLVELVDKALKAQSGFNGSVNELADKLNNAE